MNDLEQRIAIAGACGWKVETFQGEQCFVPPPPNDDGGWSLDTVPDYLNDLNAMHEAEKVLINIQRGDYSFHLQQIADGEWFLCYHATARQRAEAFLKTLNLWKP